MIGSQFSAAHEAYQDRQYARFMDEEDAAYRFESELEREMYRLGAMTLDAAMEEMGISWEDTIGSLKDRLIDVLIARTDDPY